MRNAPTTAIAFCLCLASTWGPAPAAEVAEKAEVAKTAEVAEACSPGDGDIVLLARSRVPGKDPGDTRLAYAELRCDPRRTAFIVCDLWDAHWCRGATRRVAELASRADAVLGAARARGALIVHAPSDTMRAYEGHPARRRAIAAPLATDLPEGISGGCNRIPGEEGHPWPVDQSDGGCDCEPACRQGPPWPWKRQIAAIEIRDEDAISDSGVEIWNLLTERGIENVVLIGVHTNMCVVGRPFGLRNMARFGKNVVLMRDLTDTMYNSRMRPHVPHFTGTDLVVAHIERTICPTVTSADILGEPPFFFADDRRPRVAFLSAEDEYGAAEALPEFARHLELRCGLATEVLQGQVDASAPDRNAIPGMAALERADLVVVFVRRRALPEADMARLKAHLERGRPLIALRTSSHAFSVRGEIAPGLVDWKSFDREVLGATYEGHFGGESVVFVEGGAKDHPIVALLSRGGSPMEGAAPSAPSAPVEGAALSAPSGGPDGAGPSNEEPPADSSGLPGPFPVKESLYRSRSLAPTCRILLWGVSAPKGGAEAMARAMAQGMAKGTTQDTAQGTTQDTTRGEPGKAPAPEPAAREPVAWTNAYGRAGARIFTTSIGSSWSSFREEWYRRLLVGAVFWALGREPPKGY